MITELNGEQVFVGTGSRPLSKGRSAVLFLHGAGFDHSVWVMPARYFARHGMDVLAPDLPGHGRSLGQALAQVEDMADHGIADHHDGERECDHGDQPPHVLRAHAVGGEQ